MARPLIIAHRGASGDRPEHSLAAHRLAVEQGADVIEPDLVLSRDGQLLVRHDLVLARSTDIASRPEFADRSVACGSGQDWLAADLDWHEVQRLRCREPWPDRLQVFDGRYPILRLTDLLDLARTESLRRDRPILIYPETKHPAWHRARGLDFVAALSELCRHRGLHGPDAPVWWQSFEWDVLDALRERTGLRCHALIDAQTAFEPAELRGRVDGVGIAKQRIDPRTAAGRALLDALLANDLRVHAWTFRHDQPGAGWPDADSELSAYLKLPLEAVFCDFPRRALACRAALE